MHKQPLLLDEYIHEVAELQLAPSPAVKKALCEFVRAAADATRSPTALLGCIRLVTLVHHHIPPTILCHCLHSRCLTTMAADDTASVAKTALMAAAGVMHKSMEVLLSQVHTACVCIYIYVCVVTCLRFHP